MKEAAEKSKWRKVLGQNLLTDDYIIQFPWFDFCSRHLNMTYDYYVMQHINSNTATTTTTLAFCALVLSNTEEQQ